ncbi:Zinc finger BED domain-containing protein 4 [Labeo rohita]|uniref:Zinc finger BED domain-containing protein 4 n=1 Tax=Labeo rohita TaxID=84645 RepID=A0ABQ8LBC7_LABRO|nr:Zinc finger BED domain-containing protein 4 [Labeo rohita]
MKLIKELCETLEPFEEATDKCQADKVITASYVIPCVRGLRHAAESMKPNKMSTIIKSSVEKRLSHFEDMEWFQLAATLDPRFKLDWCIGEERQTIKDILTKKVISLSAPSVPTSKDCSSPPKEVKTFCIYGHPSSFYIYTVTSIRGGTKLPKPTMSQ